MNRYTPEELEAANMALLNAHGLNSGERHALIKKLLPEASNNLLRQLRAKRFKITHERRQRQREEQDQIEKYSLEHVPVQ